MPTVDSHEDLSLRLADFRPFLSRPEAMVPHSTRSLAVTANPSPLRSSVALNPESLAAL